MASARVFATVPVLFACPSAAKPHQHPYAEPPRPYHHGSSCRSGQSSLRRQKSTFLANVLSTLSSMLTPAVAVLDLGDERTAWSLHDDQDVSF